METTELLKMLQDIISSNIHHHPAVYNLKTEEINNDEPDKNVFDNENMMMSSSSSEDEGDEMLLITEESQKDLI